MKASDLTVPEISALLTDRIDQLAADLLPGGRRLGKEWTSADLTGAAPRTGGSLRVQLDGRYQGHWRDHATGQGGDPIDLIQGALGLDKAGAVKWALGWLGLDGDTPIARPRPKPKVVEPTEEERRRAAKGPAIWRASQPIAGTLAERYLRSRGITAELPPSLRFQSGLDYWNVEGDEPIWKGRFPALIAAVTVWPSRVVLAVQTIYLDATTGGKANLDPVKKTFGPAKGGAVRLAPHGPRLALAEGIETALSVWQECLGIPMWSTVGTAGLNNVMVPPGVKSVVICADADKGGEEAAQEAAQRFMAEGCRVKIARPPHGFNDFNDALMAQMGGQPGKVIHAW